MSGDSLLENLDETYTSFCRTPLHIAVLSGDKEFAKKILVKKPDLALKRDSNGFTPLHLASVRRSYGMMKLLLRVGTADACMVQDEEGRTPLHLAAMKDRVAVMKVLMEERPQGIHLRDDHNGETILHYCVRNNCKLETLELLVNQLVLAPLPEQNPNPISINSTDNDDNTILHLAAEMGNMKIVNYLLLDSNGKIDINVVNNKGLKALNMLSKVEKNHLQFGFYGYYVRHEKHKRKILSKNGHDHEGLKERVNALVVVATLIATIAFQAAMSPPGGVWQDDSKVDSDTDPVKFTYYLKHMFTSSVSGSLDSYIEANLATTYINSSYYMHRYNSTIRGEEQRTYPIDIEYLVNDLMDLFDQEDSPYRFMALKGLLLQDFPFTDVVSYYNNSALNRSSGGFYPYLIRYAGYPILAYTYPSNYVIYMVTNGVALVLSLTIIFLAICGFTDETSLTQVRILVVLMCISIGCIACSYLSIFAAMVPYFYAGAVDVYLVLHILLGSFCLSGFCYFIGSLTSKIAKLRKRTRHHHIGVINYLQALFYSMNARATGKLTLFIVCYFAFRLNASIYFGSWSYVSAFWF